MLHFIQRGGPLLRLPASDIPARQATGAATPAHTTNRQPQTLARFGKKQMDFGYNSKQFYFINVATMFPLASGRSSAACLCWVKAGPAGCETAGRFVLAASVTTATDHAILPAHTRAGCGTADLPTRPAGHHWSCSVILNVLAIN